MSLSLPALYSRILSATARCADLPAIEDETQVRDDIHVAVSSTYFYQELVASTLKDLQSLKSGIEALSILSPGETLEDIPTRDLTYLFVPYVYSEVQGRVKTTTRVDRMNSVIVAKVRISISWSSLVSEVNSNSPFRNTLKVSLLCWRTMKSSPRRSVNFSIAKLPKFRILGNDET